MKVELCRLPRRGLECGLGDSHLHSSSSRHCHNPYMDRVLPCDAGTGHTSPTKLRVVPLDPWSLKGDLVLYMKKSKHPRAKIRLLLINLHLCIVEFMTIQMVT